MLPRLVGPTSAPASLFLILAEIAEPRRADGGGGIPIGEETAVPHVSAPGSFHDMHDLLVSHEGRSTLET